MEVQRCRYNKKVVQEQVQRWCRACAEMQRRWCRVGAERGRYVVEICRGAEVQRWSNGCAEVVHHDVVQRCRDAEVQRWCRDGAEVQIWRTCCVVQKWCRVRSCRGGVEVLVQRWYRGAEEQRSRGAERYRGAEEC